MKIDSNVRSLPAVLNACAAACPERTVFRFFDSPTGPTRDLTFAQLDAGSRSIARHLLAHTAAGERALLIYPTGLEFITAFMGCLIAGVIAVPVWSPVRGRFPDSLGAIAADAQPQLVLTSCKTLDRLNPKDKQALSDRRLTWLATDSMSPNSASAEPWQAPLLDDHQVAYLQYTSGSTRQPRGVCVTHGNLWANCAAIAECFGLDEHSVGLSWLPHCHDMGLVGNLLTPIRTGFQMVYTSPETFSKNPLGWLKAICRFKATASGGPDSAYELCARLARRSPPRGMDLSSWDVAFNGSEPVRATTLRRFSNVFEPYGFNPQAFSPCYGLAEATLLVSGSRQDEMPLVQAFDTRQLAAGVVRLAERGRPCLELVGCGRPVATQQVCICAPDRDQPRDPDRVGEIRVSGPAVASGYWEPTCGSASSHVPVAAPGCKAGLHTGDLGFWHRGQLFVTGRSRDLIILGGCNYYPQDMESTAVQCHAGIRSHAAAFQCHGDPGDPLVLALELTPPYRSEQFPHIREAVLRALARAALPTVDRLVLVKKNSLPRTANGKIRRQSCRRLYCQNGLPVLDTFSAEQFGSTFGGAEPGVSLPDIRELVRLAAAIIGVEPQTLRTDSVLHEQGLSSLRGAELNLAIEKRAGVRLSIPTPLHRMSLQEVMELLPTQPAVALADSCTAPASANKPHWNRSARPDGDGRTTQPLDMPTPPASPNGNPLERARCFEELDTLRRRGQVPFFVPLERNEGPMCRIDGRQAIMLGSNNYLGLTADPRVRRATARAALAEGPSLTGSRLLNGSTVDHRILEKRLARFLGYEEVLVFTTGYQANLGLLSALMDEKGCLLVDDACHASIYDGGFMSRCQIREFRHNDARDLEKKLSRLAPDRERFVMVDGVYSMHGDIAPLPAIDRVCHTWNTPYAVDEAHALGVLGDCGRGTQEHFDFKCRADLLTGTFSKSLASIGGWIAGENKVIDWIRFKGRSMLFSASLPPPSVAAALAALDILETEPQRLVQLHHNADYFRRRLANAGFSCGRAATPIIPIFIGDEELCLSYTGQLLASGLFVNASIHPAVPRGQSLLRTSVMATHTIDLLDQAADIIIRVGRKMGIGADRQRHGAPR